MARYALDTSFSCTKTKTESSNATCRGSPSASYKFLQALITSRLQSAMNGNYYRTIFFTDLNVTDIILTDININPEACSVKVIFVMIMSNTVDQCVSK